MYLRAISVRLYVSLSLYLSLSLVFLSLFLSLSRVAFHVSTLDLVRRVWISLYNVSRGTEAARTGERRGEERLSAVLILLPSRAFMIPT